MCNFCVFFSLSLESSNIITTMIKIFTIFFCFKRRLKSKEKFKILLFDSGLFFYVCGSFFSAVLFLLLFLIGISREFGMFVISL